MKKYDKFYEHEDPPVEGGYTGSSTHKLSLQDWTLMTLRYGGPMNIPALVRKARNDLGASELNVRPLVQKLLHEGDLFLDAWMLLHIAKDLT